MGREATTGCRIGSANGSVKALLESTELVLRGEPALRRRWPVAALQAVQVQGEALVFQAGGEAVQLALGAREAAAWARRIATPPPTLAAKLGVTAERPAFVCGRVDDDALAAALHGATTADAAAAHWLVAVVRDAQDLAAALDRFAGMHAAHAWLVYPKGRAADPGDAAIRSAWRAAGCMDSKTCAVSDTLTATRYTRQLKA